MSTATATKNPIDLFIKGARQGWTIATTSMVPNIIMAYVLIQILKITKVLDMISVGAAPIMALWGLPGAGMVVICTAFLSRGGAVGVAAGLYASGQLTGMDISVLTPGFFLMGGFLQQAGRCLGTADANRRYWGWHFIICVINGMVGMWLMRLCVQFM